MIFSLLLALALTSVPQDRVEAIYRNGKPEAAVQIDAAVTAIRIALADQSPAIREAAWATINFRALMSMWAGTRGPGVGPSPTGAPQSPPQPMIPLEWRSDRDRLRQEFFETALAVARTDPSVEVRHAAVHAAFGFEVGPSGDRDHPLRMSPRIQDFALLVLREEPSAGIRESVVQNIRIAGIVTRDAVQALAKALVDPDKSVQWNARMALSNSTALPAVGVTFSDARGILAAALSDSNRDIRMGALEAFSQLQKDAAPELSAIDKLANTDPDPDIRQFAARVATAIRK